MRPVTLVLGPGGARAFCAIGALRVLDEMGVRVGRVVGCSMGAVVGAARCAETGLEEIEKRALGVRFRDFRRGKLCSPGVVSNDGIRSVVGRLVGATRFEELGTPLTVVCTDLQAGGACGFAEGGLVAPLVGSCTPAALVEPAEHEGRLLVDGGYAAPYPIEFAPADDPVIVIDPLVVPDWKVELGPAWSPNNLLSIGQKWQQYLKSMDILIYRLGCAQAEGRAHVRIAPALGSMAFHEFGRSAEAVRLGAEAVRERRGEIEAFLG